jgi:hypothetical protein
VIVTHLIAWLALAVAVVATVNARDRVTLTTGPCTILGPASHPDLVGPHLVIDCDGVQFGVRAVLP